MELSVKFRNLREEINGVEPTVERCRDWAAELADLCEDLAVAVREAQASDMSVLAAGLIAAQLISPGERDSIDQRGVARAAELAKQIINATFAAKRE